MSDLMSTLALTCGVSSLLSALFGAALIIWNERRHNISTRQVSDDATTAFLLRGSKLVDTTPAARSYLMSLNDDGTQLEQLLRALSRKFPKFQETISDPAQTICDLVSNDGTTVLSLTKTGANCRLVLEDAEKTIVKMERGVHAAFQNEFETLRAMTQHVPFLVWRQTKSGEITWINQAYLDLADQYADNDPSIWPPAQLFDLTDQPVDAGTSRRIRMKTSDGQEQGWFECHTAQIEDEILVTAIDANAVVNAETSLREFVQTLSKTFAHLSTGLAVFDKDGRLALFNPSLTDLTKLPVETLLSRPTLSTFLDALRARNMMPEPKDYRSWRDRIADLKQAAMAGTYSELWHLPSSQTYRVTGRPQPDGAMALLIEDISAEISLTRQFRTEIETSQAVLDSLDDAICVFDSTGILTITNAAYDALWGSQTEDSFDQLTVSDAAKTWMDSTAPTPLWGDMRVFAANDVERADWSGKARLKDGRGLHCYFKPLQGGATMIRFEVTKAHRQKIDLPTAAKEAIQHRLGA